MRFKQLVGLVIAFVLGSQALAQELSYDISQPLVSETSRVDTFEADITARLYAFSATAGDSVSISMSQDNDRLDPYLVLFDSTGAILALDDDSGAFDFAALISNVEILEDGTYFVLATSKIFLDGTATSTDETLTYEIALSGANPSVEDEALTLEAEILGQGTSITGESSLEQPLAFYLYEGQAEDLINLSLSSDEFFTALNLFDPTGARVASDASVIDLSLPDNGVYLIIATDAFFFEVLEENGFFTGGGFTLESR